jgi:hypothetical protein
MSLTMTIELPVPFPPLGQRGPQGLPARSEKPALPPGRVPQGGDVQPAGRVHGRTPRCPTDALLLPQVLAGLHVETLRQPRLVDQISVAADEDGRSDALRMPLLVVPETARIRGRARPRSPLC